MHRIGAVFRSRDEALSALRSLGELTLRRSRLGMLTPGRDRASLGEAAVAGTIPGIGPAVAVGDLRGLLAVTTTGPRDAPENQAHPHAGHAEEDVDTCHEAVRRGCSVVLVLVADDSDAGAARNSLLGVGEPIDDARKRWEEEAQAYALAREILRPSLY
jgi:hypothetical protein